MLSEAVPPLSVIVAVPSDNGLASSMPPALTLTAPPIELPLPVIANLPALTLIAPVVNRSVVIVLTPLAPCVRLLTVNEPAPVAVKLYPVASWEMNMSVTSTSAACMSISSPTPARPTSSNVTSSMVVGRESRTQFPAVAQLASTEPSQTTLTCAEIGAAIIIPIANTIVRA